MLAISLRAMRAALSSMGCLARAVNLIVRAKAMRASRLGKAERAPVGAKASERDDRMRPGLDLPPHFAHYRLREKEDAFVTAKAEASRVGPGALFTVGRFDAIELALTLAPDAPMPRARRGFFLCMTALAEALVARAPPERPFAIAWPDLILVDGMAVGRGHFWTAPDAVTPTLADASPEEPPSCAIFSIAINVDLVRDPERIPLAMSLAEAGFELEEREAILVSFCRHLLSALDADAHEGFAVAVKPYLNLLERKIAGQMFALEEGGDLLSRIGPRGPIERFRFPAGNALAPDHSPLPASLPGATP